MTPTKPVAVLGAGGQVGTNGVGLGRLEGDLTRITAVLDALDRINPSALINAAAYTKVDLAEVEKGAAWQINAEAPGRLAQWAHSKDIPFIHYSTDYVFSDDKDPKNEARPWTEADATAPINVYGMSKREGEVRVAAQGGNFLIFRTSWVYDASGKNFLNTMLRLGAEKESISVVADQFGAPTYAKDLADATLKALTTALAAQAFPAGIYHLTNKGATSWHGFAKAILDGARAQGFPLKVGDIKPIPSSAYPTPAPRPKNSRLSNEKFRTTFGFELRTWDDALIECLLEKRGQ